jgi:hypothetical protein
MHRMLTIVRWIFSVVSGVLGILVLSGFSPRTSWVFGTAGVCFAFCAIMNPLLARHLRFLNRPWKTVLSASLCMVAGTVGIVLLLADPAPTPFTPGTVGPLHTLRFALKPISGDDPNVRRWSASYPAQGKTAVFRIELNKPEKDSSDTLHGTGRFISVPDSDSSVMLTDLKTTLGANSLPQNVSRQSVLSFSYRVWKEHTTNTGNGYFNGDSGNWMTTNISIQNGPAEYDVVIMSMSLDPVDGLGEFGQDMANDAKGANDDLLTKLASIL